MSVSPAFPDSIVDARYPAEQSVVLRYRHALRFGATDKEDAAFKDLLAKTSIREGTRVFPLLTYKDVQISIQDETSLMHTRTLKSIDGCVTIARCLEQGYHTVVFESGGNTGTALTAYGTRAGLETFLFLPEENTPLLNSQVFGHPKAHLIAVEDPGTVKSAARLFEESHRFPHIPRTPWRIEASKFRGMFVVEHIARHGGFDWLIQTISAGFGPIGIFWALAKYRKELGTTPRFLGIQQEANCPMYQAWKTRQTNIPPARLESTSKLLTKVMYDTNPQTYGTRDDLMNLLDATNGELTTLDHAEFERFLARPLAGKTPVEHLR